MRANHFNSNTYNQTQPNHQNISGPSVQNQPNYQSMKNPDVRQLKTQIYHL